jgi:hypothetical protein
MNYEEMFKQIYYGDRGPLSPVKCSIVVQSSSLKVWNKLMDVKSWNSWWGTLRSVKPYWKKGAILSWENGGDSEVTVFEEQKTISIAGPLVEMTIRLQLRDNSTEL